MLGKIKTFSLFITVVFFGALQAISQKRMVDQEAICISPVGEVVNGEGLPLEFEMLNHGPDPRYKNDSILYWLYVTEENGYTWLMYQGFLVSEDTGEVVVGGTRRYGGGYGVKFDYPQRNRPYDIDFCVAITTFSVDDNGDTIQYFGHEDPNLANNVCCKKVTILPKSTSGTTQIVGEEEFWIYPNPTSDILYINTSANFAAKGFAIFIYDIRGHVVLEKQYVGGQPLEKSSIINTSALPQGIYHLRLQSPDAIINRKFVIQK